MKRSITIVGSTGSIGVQALEVAARFPQEFRVVGLAAHHDWETLAQQTERFCPREISMADPEACSRLAARLSGFPVTIHHGEEGSARIASLEEAEVSLIATVGISGLIPALSALSAGKTVALATKEALVAAGPLMMEEARARNTLLIPVDSEHSALFQCLQGERKEHARRLILTSSGGPFRGFGRERLSQVTPACALAHPTWKMGKKITIDSATLMNKGFEVIEACHLFSMPPEQVDVVVHPQSVIHSLVEFIDGSTKAQLSLPDMRIPIQYALSYPARLPSLWQSLDLASLKSLTFEEPDRKTFRALDLAYEACRAGGTMPCVMNGANEIAVKSFLDGGTGFLQIAEIIERTMEAHCIVPHPSLEEIMQSDAWARAFARELAGSLAGSK